MIDSYRAEADRQHFDDDEACSQSRSRHGGWTVLLKWLSMHKVLILAKT